MARAGFWAVESHTIRLGRDGSWYADAERIENPRIASLFSRSVQRGADGDWWLVVGDERARIVVEDTPFFVVRVDGNPADGFTAGLNDGTSEPLVAASLRLGDGGALYCEVKLGEFAARFLRPAQAELLSHVVADGGVFYLPLPGSARQRIDDTSSQPHGMTRTGP